MAGFQAVDLDSILDEFEFNQSEAEKEGRTESDRFVYQGDKEKTKTWSPSQLTVSSVSNSFVNFTIVRSPSPIICPYYDGPT